MEGKENCPQTAQRLNNCQAPVPRICAEVVSFAFSWKVPSSFSIVSFSEACDGFSQSLPSTCR